MLLLARSCTHSPAQAKEKVETQSPGHDSQFFPPHPSPEVEKTVENTGAQRVVAGTGGEGNEGAEEEKEFVDDYCVECVVGHDEKGAEQSSYDVQEGRDADEAPRSTLHPNFQVKEPPTLRRMQTAKVEPKDSENTTATASKEDPFATGYSSPGAAVDSDAEGLKDDVEKRKAKGTHKARSIHMGFGSTCNIHYVSMLVTCGASHSAL